MDDDLGLDLNDSFDDGDGSPSFRGRGRGRGRSGFRPSRGMERFTFKPRTPRGGPRGGGRGGGDWFMSNRGRGRGEGIRRGRGESRRGRGDDIRSPYDYELPRGGYKEREYGNSRDYQSDFRSPPSRAQNGYSSQGGNDRGPRRGGFATPRRGGFDYYGQRSSYGGSYSASKGSPDYPEYPPERDFNDSYTYGRESRFDKYRDERYPPRDHRYRGSPQYREEFRRSSPPLRRMSPPRRRSGFPPPQQMSPPRRRSGFPPPPSRFRSRSPIMRRSRSPIGRGGRFRGAPRGGPGRPWTPPPPPKRARSRSPRYMERGPPKKEFYDRERFRGRGGRGFRPREYSPPKPGFRPKGPYSGERY